MAKPTKVEEYWRQHNIEGLFKDLTHILVQRMPPDPAVAIVQHLQKKFPASFKTSTDNNNSFNNNNTGIASKTMANSLQLQSMTSAHSDVNNESIGSIKMRRRSSDQSQISGIVTIPTVGSAFTDLLKQNTIGAKQAPELDIKSLVFANRLTQQAVKMGKNIRSDRDIIEDELIKPMYSTTHVPSTTHVSVESVSEERQDAQSREEPSVEQLIQYKKQMRLENDRRLHRAKLAEIAKQAHEKDPSHRLNVSTKPDEHQQHKLGDDHTLSHGAPETSSTKPIRKPIVKSKEEEEILNDENIFQSKSHRPRERNKKRAPTSRSNTPTARKQYVAGVGSSAPLVQFGVCKVCGNMMNNEGNRMITYSQQVSGTPTGRSFDHQPVSNSIASSGDGAAVDDWFESASDVSGPRQVSPWNTDDITPTPPITTTNPFRENLFQPINDNDTTQRRPPVAPIIITDDESKGRRSTTSHLSQSDVFVRTPEPRSRRSSTPRSITSPVTKKHQTNTLAIDNDRHSKPMEHLSLSQTVPTTQRRMSGWSVTEHTPDDSDEN